MITPHHPHWDAVLDAWSAGTPSAVIMDRLDVSRATIGSVVQGARQAGDKRAGRRYKPGSGVRSGTRHKASGWHYLAREERAKGATWAAIARRYGVTPMAVKYAVLHGAGSDQPVAEMEAAA